MPNRLAGETSPYLLQHANNPVDWFPWGTEALERAKAEDKPILLSVGYSACHWCHVMERESFEDHATAELMNRDFINIKVDREERPDLDEIYMRAVQAFTGGHGGWPMTVFLHPDGRPYFGGTYFPPEPSRGMPSFGQVMARATELYRNDRSMLDKLSGQVLEAIDHGGRALPAPNEANDDWLAAIADAANEDFDEKWAGFGGAPKFPPHGVLAALLAHHRKTGAKRSLEMVTRTLDAMARGGMYDLLGGGFARYSVDARWCIPHFEKMLYDNAQLVPVYLDAYAITGDESYRAIAEETLAWAVREMQDDSGGFYSAQDADSEGVEGKFFVFKPNEMSEEAAALFSVTEEGNFEHGFSALRLAKERRADLSAEQRALFDRVRLELYTYRDQRIWPGTDDKVLASWNAMMISAFAKSARVLGDRAHRAIAERAAKFILGSMVQDGRLLRTYKNGRSHILAYAEDYVLLSAALLDLYETTFDPSWLQWAAHFADETVRLFWDEAEGGLFLTGHDAEKLVARTKTFISGATPSGNGAAALLFARLDAMLDRRDLGDKADHILRGYEAYVERAPRALGIEAIAHAWRRGGTQEIGIAGDDDRFLAELHKRYLPFSVIAKSDPLIPWMEGRPVVAGKTTAYVCRDRACRAPATELDSFIAELDLIQRPEPKKPPALGRVRAPKMPVDPSLWLNTERPLSLEELEGQIVVLDFFTYCCINCMHVLPELEAIEKRFAKDPVVVIGVHSAKFTAEKERENVRRAIHRHRITHPVLLDSEHTMWSEHAISAWPTVVVLDATGRVAWRKSGEVEREELGKVVARLLEEGREAHQLNERLAITPDEDEGESTLYFPGKTHVFPDAQTQSLGLDPFGVDSRLYIADSGHHRIIEAQMAIGAAGFPEARIMRIFGSGEPGLRDGSVGDAQFRAPQGIYRFENRLYVADTENHALRVIDLENGYVKTLAGTGRRGTGGRGDPARPKEMSLRSPWDVACLEGGVFLAMAGTHQIWVYLPDQEQIGPMIGSGREAHVDGPVGEAALAQPSGLALFGHLLFFADSETSSIRLADLRNNQVATVVGRGLFDFGDVDGRGDIVRLQHPLGVAAIDGKVYVADTFNDKIKLIELDGVVVSTLSSGVREPGGLAIAGDFLIVADTANHRISAVHRTTGETRPIELL
jgi:uncharacterized protein YyaL (SSP411 family)/thiol-disulfide isomerase/thioredoxin